MESDINATASRQHSHAGRTFRRGSFSLRAGLAVMAYLMLVLAVLWLVRAPKVGTNGELISNSGSVQGALANPESAATIQTAAGQDAVVAASQSVQPREGAPPPVPTPEARRLVETLIHLEPTGGVLTQEQAAVWKQNLQDLIAQGLAGAAAF